MKPAVRKRVLAQLTAAKKKKLRAMEARAKKEKWSKFIVGPQDLFAMADGCYFDRRFADHAVNFFNKCLIHATGMFAGQPFTLQPWQEFDIVRPLFGWRRPNKSRRYHSAFIFMAKKNGKTTLCSGLVLYQLTAEPDPDHTERTEQAAEIYAASTSMENGAILYRESRKLTHKSPPLRKRLETLDHTKTITYRATSSFFRVLPHKAESAEGMLASGVYLDEVHAMKNRKLYAALRWAGASRMQPLVVEITTAGIDDDEALWKSRYEYTKRVLDGEHVDWSHLGFICEADIDAEIDDILQLRKANPSLGVTIPEDRILQEARQAKAEGSRAINEFKRYRLNVAVGASVGWLSPDQWDKGQKPFNVLDLVDRPCLAGLDLAKVSDFSALVLLWPPPEEENPDKGIWHGALWLWLPRAKIDERMALGDMSYHDWAERGLIEVTDGDTTDHQLIRKRIKELAGRFTIRQLGIDRGFEGWQFTQDLFNDDELPAVGIGQGWRSQDVPMQRIEAMVQTKRMNFAGHPIMRWMVGNAIAKKVGSNGNYHLDRANRSKKVDGMAALINAVYLAEATPADEQQTYEESPLVLLD